MLRHFAALVLPVALGVAAGLLLYSRVPVLAAFALLALCLAAWLSWKSAGERVRGERSNREIFERPGISLWREDWSAVAEAILTVRRSGVSDVQAHFIARPDEARRLREAVLITDVNAFTLSMMGVARKEDLVGSLARILPNTDQTFDQWLLALSNGERFYRSETHITRPDGSVMDVLFTAALPDSLEGFKDIIVTAVDVSGYRAGQDRMARMQAEVARAARITTMGTLTASIAHEVNSPLAAVVSHAQAAQRWLDRPEPQLEEARSAMVAAVRDGLRARDVVARIRSFLGNAADRGERMDLAAVARDAILLIERELRRLGISVHLDAAANLPAVVADPVQIGQVLVNLMLNGAQAMAHLREPKDLTVRIRHEDGKVVTEVRDRGAGIPPDSMARLFEPFYSTREGGMGMGLAICRNCVEAAGGRIWATSEPGQGATFRFSLPTPEGYGAGHPSPAR
ncbi:sensor histidine kinase [Roseomonas elaeocarpi]|uniref:histidine kinase n=1 Tax=Roseomonas elaeocarpi TaxID=907779 RepID=A0ABV6JYV6_9PROT